MVSEFLQRLLDHKYARLSRETCQSGDWFVDWSVLDNGRFGVPEVDRAVHGFSAGRSIYRVGILF